jgi:hypothetical protein
MWMPLKRWRFWAVTALVLVAITAGYLFIPVSPPRITQANCDKIQFGWTPEQVVELLGPHYFRSKPLDEGERLSPVWDDEDANRIVLTFTQDGVISKRFEPTELTFFELMERRVKRRIESVLARLSY